MAMKVFLVPPPELPVPAVKGGAVETLLEHLIFENEKQGKLELYCASIPDSEAQAKTAHLRHTKMIWLPAEPNRRQGYCYVCGARRRLGLPAPLDPWYEQVRREIRRIKPDFAISEGGDPTEFARISRMLGPARCLLHLHGPTQGGPRLDPLYGGVLSLSEFTRREFLQTSQIPPQKVRVLPNCIDLDHFHPSLPPDADALRLKLGFTPADFIVLFCGRIAEEKGIHKLVQAFSLLQDPRYKLLIVGSPFFAAQATSPFLEKLKADAAALGDCIRFTGFVPHEELPLYYGAADLACFPALWQEPAGLVAIEAMACGRPVLATKSGGMTEYLAGSDAVELPIEPQSELPRALADAIRTLADDPERRWMMRRRGLMRSRSFGQQAYYQNFVQLLEYYQTLKHKKEP